MSVRWSVQHLVAEWEKECEEETNLNRERFFRFGLDLQLEEVDRPEDLESWTDKPFTGSNGSRRGFAEENLETVLSANVGTLLADEEWLLIGRQEATVREADLTTLNQACDLILFEIKPGLAKPEVIEQGLDYLIRAPGLAYSHYLDRYLNLQCYRDYKEAVRLLGLLKGDRFDRSGAAKEGNWATLRDENDTSITNKQFLSLGRDLLRRINYPPFDVLSHPERALADKFRSHFGFDGQHLLEDRLGKSVNLALVAEEFSDKILERVQTHYQRNTFFYVLRAKLYRHIRDPHSFLLGFMHLVPDGVMGNGDVTSIPTAFTIWRFLDLVKQEIIRLEALDRQTGGDLSGIPLYTWGWSFSKYNNLRFFPLEAGYYGELHVDLDSLVARWGLAWMTQGTRPSTRERIRSRLRQEKSQLPSCLRFTNGGALIKELDLQGELPGLWSVSVEALPSRETATVAFIVQPPSVMGNQQ